MSRSMLTLLAMAVLAAANPPAPDPVPADPAAAGPAAQQAPPQPAGGGAELPERWLGPGPEHKVLVPADQPWRAEALRASGAARLEVDYGAFTLFVLDESLYGGRKALQNAGLVLRDEYDLIPLNGYRLNGTRPASTLAQLHPDEFIADASDGSMNAHAGLYLVQFVGPVLDAWLEELRGTGTRIVQYMPMNAYVVAAPPGTVPRLRQLQQQRPWLQYTGVWQPAFRMTPAIRQAAERNDGRPRPVTLQLVNGAGIRDLLDGIQAVAAGAVTTARVGPYLNVAADLDPRWVRLLARQPQVFAIETRGVPTRFDERQGQISAGNLSGAGPSAPGYLSWLAGMGFDATQFGSFSVNVVDDATSLSGHADLPSGRIAFQENPTGQTGQQGGHGFLNAHIVGGFNNSTGSSFEDSGGYQYGLGMAPWAQVGSTAIFGTGFPSGPTWEDTAYSLGARISSNSWGFQTGGGGPVADYDSWAQSYDFVVRDARSGQTGNQQYMVIFAAGNDGPGTNTVSTPGTAKNIVSVGASENQRTTGTDGCGINNNGANDVADLISFSSHGPVDSGGGDGRTKPEIVAPGTHIQAGVPQSNYNGTSVCNQYWPSGQTLYGWSSGTSHSTPAVAGAAALVHQWFLNQGMAAPSPAINKAVLINSADYMTGAFANDTLPSNSQGMGRMNLGPAFDGVARTLVDQTELLTATGQSFTVTGDVANPGSPFRVTLVWTDAPGSTTGAPWVNDLDLSVTVGGSTYLGNVFSGSLSTTGGSADFRNNNESVFLAAGQAGTFSVTVTAATIAGDGVPGNGDSTDQDFALVIYNATTGGGPTGPVALFSGTPTSGLVPLTVGFTDQSVGTVTSWAWDFGDTGTSSLQNPSHTYTAAGSYTVNLTVTGPDGSDTNTKPSYITASDPPPPGVNDGSFEAQTAGFAPTTPWTITFGAGHVINPSGVSSDSGMPVDGANWCELAADSTNGATPPDNPGGVTNPAVGGAGISQSFSYGSGATELTFSASFLRNEDPNSFYNDWMSVDVGDGSTWVNLFYKDTFSATSGTSSKYGYPITPVQTVTVDLVSLFPSSTTSTVFTLTAQIGNAVDDFQPSKGYVDDFQMGGTAAPPVADFSGTPTSGVSPLAVVFTDLSTGGPIDTWSWNFGDAASSTTQNPSHTYASAGTYTVSLTVTGPGGTDTQTKVGYITVAEPPPVADFSGTPTSGALPLFVAFTDLSSGGPVSTWSWDFGDTGTSTLQDPSHTYASAGTYTVSLTVTGPGGTDTQTKVGYITVVEPPPVADFSGTPTSGTLPLVVAFTDLSSGGPIDTWSWDFGDTGTSSLQNPSHTYSSAGTFTVSLTVSGPGGTDTQTKVDTITVVDGTFVQYGVGSGGSFGVPDLNGAGDLTPGGAIGFTLTVSNGAPLAPIVLLVGAVDAAVPLFGQTIAVDPILVQIPLGNTDADGAYTLPAFVPDGTPPVSVYIQVWLLDPTGVQGFSSTNGLRMDIP